MTIVKQSFPPFGSARARLAPATPAPTTADLGRLAELEVRLDSHARVLWQ